MQEVLVDAPARRAEARATVSTAGVLDTLGVVADVILPTYAKGILMRRRAVMAIAGLLDLDRRAIRRMERIRDKYGSDPLMLSIPGRDLALILDPQHVHRILQQSPDPFATTTPE